MDKEFKKLLDELMPPTTKYCIKTVDYNEFGQLSSALHCDKVPNRPKEIKT